MRYSIARSKLAVAVVAGMVIIVMATTAVLAASVAKNGKAVTAVRTVTSADYLSTSSTTFVDVPGMSTTVSVPADQRALLIVTFSGQDECYPFSLTAEADCLIRVVVDGNTASPGSIVLRGGRAGDTGFGWDANSMQFVYGPINAGSHTVKVQWKVFNYDGTSEFHLSGSTLTVLRSAV